jgi:hypothetical protein
MVAARTKKLVGCGVCGTETGHGPVGDRVGVDIVLVDGEKSIFRTVFSTDGKAAEQIRVDSLLPETGQMLHGTAQNGIGAFGRVVLVEVFKGGG